MAFRRKVVGLIMSCNVLSTLSFIPNLIIVTMFKLHGSGVLSIILAIAMTGWLSAARQVCNIIIEGTTMCWGRKSLRKSNKIAIKHLIRIYWDNYCSSHDGRAEYH